MRAAVRTGAPSLRALLVAALACAGAAGALAGCLSLDEQVASLTPGAVDEDGDPFEHGDRVDAIGDLVEGLAEGDEDVAARREAIATGLFAALEDPSALIRQQAVLALPGFAGARAAGPIGARLRDQDRWVRVEAARALGALAVEEGRAALEDALARDADWMVRREAAAGLVGIGSKASLPSLYHGLGDGAPAVRLACAEALAALTGKDHGEDPRLWRAELDR